MLLPVLIGAGVVLSAVAYLVEQVSRVTAVPVAEHELARGLSTMALPIEGLAPLGRPLTRGPCPSTHRRWGGCGAGSRPVGSLPSWPLDSSPGCSTS